MARGKYSIALTERLCARLEAGESLRKAAAAEGVDPMAVIRWTERYPDFGLRYAQARARGYEQLAEEIVDISDECEVEAQYRGKDVTIELSAAAVARNRLRIDARKWILAKMLPKKYGDAQNINLTGRLDISKLSDEDLEAELAQAVAAANAAKPAT